jgi:LysR family transcriptional regulator, regulator for bpeEF and oprC
MEKFGGIAEFVATVEAASFVHAAQRLGMTPSGVGKAVSRLESRLGVRLLRRSTRRLTVTEAGAECYQKFRQFLHELDEMEHTMSEADKPLQGTLRIHLPPGLARVRIMPALPRFFEAHPSMMLNIALRNDPIDLIEEGVDLTVRVGNFDGANIISRRVGLTRYVTCCSPKYLQALGTPEQPEDLLQHNCLRYVSRLTGRPRNWVFTQDGAPLALALTGNLSLNNSDALIEAALAGIGIVQVPDYTAETALRRGTLVHILAPWTAPEQQVSAVYPAMRRASRKVTAFVDFLRETFRAAPPSRLEGVSDRPISGTDVRSSGVARDAVSPHHVLGE